MALTIHHIMVTVTESETPEEFSALIITDPLEELTPEKAYDELVYTPAKYHIRRHIVHKYKVSANHSQPSTRE